MVNGELEILWIIVLIVDVNVFVFKGQFIVRNSAVDMIVGFVVINLFIVTYKYMIFFFG